MANLLYREPGSLSGKLELEEHGQPIRMDRFGKSCREGV
jgi:hypothetical protein